MQELIRSNAELQTALGAESRLRAQAEDCLQKLTSAPAAPAESPGEMSLRCELSLALEELQVMQEELQAAHDALSAERRRSEC